MGNTVKTCGHPIMRNRLQERLARAIVNLLKPVARMAYRCQMDYRQFNELVRIAFVEVAVSDFGIRKRPTNLSRTAIITGLTRKEAKRLNDLLQGEDLLKDMKPLVYDQVLAVWHSDPKFSTKSGRPRAIDYQGGPNSFCELCAHVPADLPPGAMRAELKRVGAVVDDNGKLRATRKTVFDEKQADLVSEVVETVLTPAAEIGLTSVVEQSVRGRRNAMTVVSSPPLKSSDLNSFRKLVNRRLWSLKRKLSELGEAYGGVVGDEADENQKTLKTVVLQYEIEGS